MSLNDEKKLRVQSWVVGLLYLFFFIYAGKANSKFVAQDKFLALFCFPGMPLLGLTIMAFLVIKDKRLAQAKVKQYNDAAIFAFWLLFWSYLGFSLFGW